MSGVFKGFTLLLLGTVYAQFNLKALKPNITYDTNELQGWLGKTKDTETWYYKQIAPQGIYLTK